MKKLFVLLLAAVMCLFMFACGNTPQTNEQTNSSEETTSPIKTKDELLKEAKVVKADELLNEIGGNKAKAATYVGSIYCITGHVLEIEEDYCLLLAADTGDWNNVIHSDNWYAYAELAMFRVYLPVEELTKLIKCENIEVVGEITDTGTFTYAKIEPLYLDITNAYLVSENVEYQGRKR